MQTKKYIKKIIPIDEGSNSDARAARLRRLRTLANLSRKEICEGADLNVNTYKGWELGRYGGLPKDGAAKVIARVATEGVFCSEDWLLHGVGVAPTVAVDLQTLTSEVADAAGERAHIHTELQLFKSHYPNAVDFIIFDDGMLPHYAIGDVVAGVPVTLEAITNALGKDCIIGLKNGKQVVRNLRAGSSADKFILVCTNPLTTVVNPILHDLEITYAAPIGWHRKEIIS